MNEVQFLLNNPVERVYPDNAYRHLGKKFVVGMFLSNMRQFVYVYFLPTLLFPGDAIAPEHKIQERKGCLFQVCFNQVEPLHTNGPVFSFQPVDPGYFEDEQSQVYHTDKN